MLDIGCGEGELVQCLCNPAPWLEVTTDDPSIPMPEPDECMHPELVHALDISTTDLQCVVEGTKPRTGLSDANDWQMMIRWESMVVKVWEGSLESFNPEFVGIECIVSTEVCVFYLCNNRNVS